MGNRRCLGRAGNASSAGGTGRVYDVGPFGQDATNVRVEPRGSPLIDWLEEPPGEAILAALPFERLVGERRGRYLVAWLGGVPVGHLHLADGDVPELQDVYVAAGHRGRGIASALIDAAEAASVARGAASTRIEVSLANDDARRLYERLGYVRDDAPPRRVHGRIAVRSGMLDVDDELVGLTKHL